MVELKPCPFCGDEAYCYYDENSNRFMVKCFKCGANVMRKSSEHYGCTRDYMNQVISSWNKRERKEGYWIEDSNGDSVSCSECGCEVNTNINDVTYKYCPECGTRMNNV